MSGPALLDEVRELIRRGELLEAYDRASELARSGTGGPEASYLAALALARAGATDNAERILNGNRRSELSPNEGRELEEDWRSLAARCAKDRALRATDHTRTTLLGEAADAYERVWEQYGSTHAGVNAATLRALAGANNDAAVIAAAVLEGISYGGQFADPLAVYYREATEAEASICLGALDRAGDALRRAGEVNRHDHSARATTCRQVGLLCDHLGIDRSILAPIRNPTVAHFTGHVAGGEHRPGRLRSEDESVVGDRTRELLDSRDVGFAYGSLASGGDIICAEALLERGAELHVILPFALDEFVRVSVLSGGRHWLPRFEECLSRASSVSYATEESFLDDQLLFCYCARLAMGRAVLRARFLETAAEQLAVFDGHDTGTGFGTSADVQRWQSSGRITHVIPIPLRNASSSSTDDAQPGQVRRVERTVLFGDLQGFSRLGDAVLPTFVREVVRPMAQVLERYDESILHRNRWGDGLHVVFDDGSAAANCALDLQDALREIDLEALGLPSDLRLRVGIHAGPVFEGTDPIRNEPAFFGAAVTRAARVEPATPPGDVYVTEPFAAILELEGPENLETHYVGRVPTAKGYGELPMSLLRRVL